MDELELRRRLYAEPNNIDEAIAQALSHQPKAQKLAHDLQQLDLQLHQALNVDVPEGLSDRLMLRQTISRHETQKKRWRVSLALAASVALTIGLTIGVMQPGNPDLTQQALAHVYESDGYMHSIDENASLEQVNLKLASFGSQFESSFGHIFYANYCDLKGAQSLHLIVGTGQGSAQQRVQVFLVPLDETLKAKQKLSDKQFADEQYQGKLQRVGDLGLIVIGDNAELVEQTRQRVRQSMTNQTI